jgi:hypothetical protein
VGADRGGRAALDRALARLRGGGAAPSHVHRVEGALDPLLEEFRTPVDWSFSQLTGDGYPVELLFDAARGFVGFTSEVAPAAACPGDRAERALAHAPGALRPRCRELLAAPGGPGDGPGAVWLGGRLSPTGVRSKLYRAPAPSRAAGGPLAEWVHPALSAPRLQMAAVDLETGAEEAYLSVERLEPWHVEAQLGRCGLGGGWPLVGDAIEETTGRRLPRALPGGRAGFSWTPGTLTLYLFARSAVGSDALVRPAFLRIIGALGGDPGPYAAATRPIRERRDPRTHHGMLAFAVSEEGGLRVAVGLRPPPAAR